MVPRHIFPEVQKIHMKVGEYVSTNKSRKCATTRRKNDQTRLSFGPSTKHDPKGVYLTSDELAYWDDRFALSDTESSDIERTVGSLMSHKPLISTDALAGRNPFVNIQNGSNTRSEGCSIQAGSRLSRWVHWQTAPIPTKVIDHSSSSNTLRSVLEFIDNIQMNPDLSLTYDSEMRAFLNKDDVRHEGDKVLRRKQNRRRLLDDDEDEDFKMPNKKRARETVQTDLSLTSSDNTSSSPHPETSHLVDNASSSPHPDTSHLLDREFKVHVSSSSHELDCNEVHTTMPLASQSVVPLPPNMESIDWLDEITSSQISTQSFAPISSTNMSTLKISSTITPITASISAISSSVMPNTASLSTNSTISSSIVTHNTVSLSTNSTLSSSSQNTSSPSHQKKGSFNKQHYNKDFQFATPKQPLSGKRKLQLLNGKTLVHNCPSMISNSSDDCSIVSNTCSDSLSDIPSAILFGDEEEEEEMLNPFVILESPEKKPEPVNLSEYNNRQNCTTPGIPKPVIKTSYQISTIEQDNENIQQTSKSSLTFTPKRKTSLVVRPPECPTSDTPSLVDHSTESLALSPAALPRIHTHSTPSHTLTSPTSKISRHISETPDSEEKFINRRIVQRTKRSFKQPDFLCSQIHSTRKEESPELEIMEEGMGLSLSDETVMEEGVGLDLCVNKDIIKQSSPISPGLKHNEDPCKYRQSNALVPVNGSSVFNKRNLERMKNRKYALESDDDDFIKPVKKRLVITTCTTSNTIRRTQPLASMKEERKEFDFVEEEADMSRDYWSDDEREESTGYEYDYNDSFINDNSILTQGVSPIITKNGRTSKPVKSPLNIDDVYRKSLRSPDNLFDGKRTGFGNQYKLVFSQRYKLLNHYTKKAGLKISSSAKRPYGKQRVRDLRKEVEDSLIDNDENEAEEVNKFIDDSELPVSQEELNVLKDEEMSVFPEEVSDEDIELIQQEKDIIGKKTRRAYFLSDSESVEDNSLVLTSSSYQENIDKSPERRKTISLDMSDEEMDEDKEEELGVFEDEREEIDEWNLREDNEAVCSEEQCMMIAVLVREGVIVSPSLKVSTMRQQIILYY